MEWASQCFLSLVRAFQLLLMWVHNGTLCVYPFILLTFYWKALLISKSYKLLENFFTNFQLVEVLIFSLRSIITQNK